MSGQPSLAARKPWDRMSADERVEWAEFARSKDKHIGRFTVEEIITYRNLAQEHNELADECRDFERAIDEAKQDLEATEPLRDAAKRKLVEYHAEIEKAAAEREALVEGRQS